VRVYLPAATRPADPAAVAPPRPVDLTGTETILVVEDDDGIRSLAQRALSRLGYRVLVAQDAMQALVVYNRFRGHIDLLITDVVMPTMSGGELVRRLEALGADLRVLYVTGYSDDVLVRNGIRQNKATLLRKPFTPEPLALKVREVLDRPTAPSRVAPRRPRILVVDDDPAIRRSLRRILGDQEVSEAGSISEARALLSQGGPFDAILCDVSLGDGSGLALHRWLDAEIPELRSRVVLVSGGFQDPADEDYARRAGLPTVEKPFSPEDLRAVLDRVAGTGDAATPE
jgi:DNA-binding NtrC family response regulator